MTDRWQAGREERMADSFPVSEAQALMARLKLAGYSHPMIVAETGLSKSTLTKINQARIERVTGDTYKRLSQLAAAVAAEGPLLRQRFDAEPLICAIATLYGSVKSASEVTGDSDLWAKLTKLRNGGLSWWQADRWANRFGWHPMWVWRDQWIEAEPQPERPAADVSGDGHYFLAVVTVGDDEPVEAQEVAVA